MSQYKKLVTLSLRLVTFVFLGQGMLGLLFQVSTPQDASTIYSGQAFSSVSLTLFGLVGYFLSPLLGRLIAYDHELGYRSLTE